MKIAYHLIYWIVLFTLVVGIVYQRVHIEHDHAICLINTYGHPEWEGGD